MQLQVLIQLALASLALGQDTALINGVFSDVQAHSQEYLSYIGGGSGGVPMGLLSLYREAQTYTDQGYTSLFSEVDVGEVSSFATGLPWYSSRLETYFEAANTGDSSGSGSSGGASESGSSGSGGSGSTVSGSSASSIISSITSSAASASSGGAGGSGGSSSSGGSGGSDSESGSSGGSGGSSSGGSGGSDSSSSDSSSGGGSSGGVALREQSGKLAYMVIPFVMLIAAPALL